MIAVQSKNKKISIQVIKMRKENPVRYSSAVGEAWMHCEFKIKYRHPIFDDEIYREAMIFGILLIKSSCISIASFPTSEYSSTSSIS